MPINKFQLVGQWGPDAKRKYGYDTKDIRILTNPKAVEKIHKKWSNSKYDFDLYFLRSYQGYKNTEENEVSSAWVKENLGIDVQPNEDAITMIFTQNTGDEKMPMTAWTIAHRLGHAVRRDKNMIYYFLNEVVNDFRELLYNIYKVENTGLDPENSRGHLKINQYTHEKTLRALAQAVGTMRSARQGNLTRFQEFPFELIAQYIITGRIKFNPIPKNLITQMRMVFGRPYPDMLRSRIQDKELEEWNYQLQNHADKYEQHLDAIFSGLVGKIFVM